MHILSALFGLTLIAHSPALQVQTPAEPSMSMEKSIEQWVPTVGDRLVVDTKDNEGYLIHQDGTFAKFLVATGRNEVIHYIDTYKATTPVGSWQVKSKTIQTDRVTFGEKGDFLRLYRNGDATHYGIHNYAYLDKIFAGSTEDRFFSYGCILVKDNILQILEKIYALNGGELDVATVYGLGSVFVAQN